MTTSGAEKKPGRNEPCPCGSGKKYKKCHGRQGDLKPRSREVYIGFGEKFDGMTISEAGDVHVRTLSGERVPAESVFSQSVYTKDSGKSKVLNLAPGKFAPNLGAYLLSFNAVCAIDTNTKTIRGERVSIGCLVESHTRRVSEEQAVMDYHVHGIMAFKNADEPEKFAWSKVVGMAMQGRSYSDSVKIGMITDHDLGNHAKYMARELPIYKGTFLPATITLIYSSTDAGKEDVTNFLLSLADKQAGEVLRQLEEKGTAMFEGRTISIDDIQDVRVE